jgi:hypothetical protein
LSKIKTILASLNSLDAKLQLSLAYHPYSPRPTDKVKGYTEPLFGKERLFTDQDEVDFSWLFENKALLCTV